MSKYHLNIKTDSRYLPEKSNPIKGEYWFDYIVTITNIGTIAAQIVARHWIIQDEKGVVTHAKGRGVVDKQPLLQPGQSFHYQSSCSLPTPGGTLHGSYVCVADDGVLFTSLIAPFFLDAGSARSDDGSAGGAKVVLH